MSRSIESNPIQTDYAKELHPEDIEIGDYVAISKSVYQYPSYLWHHDYASLPPHEPVNVTLLSYSVVPLKVEAICVPFVLCRCPDEKTQCLDLRQTQLFRLTQEFAEAMRSSLKLEKQPSDKDKKKKKKRNKRKKRNKKN